MFMLKEFSCYDKLFFKFLLQETLSSILSQDLVQIMS